VGTVNGTADGTAASATTINSIALTSGQSGINYLFGDVKAITLSGTVYVDANGNNAFDSGEPGLSGVTVTLSGTNGLGQSISATATTAANGTYSFSTDSNGNQLRPGSYTITETQPSGYLLGAAAAGTVNGAADGTVSSQTKISSIALTSGQSGINYNFGDFQPVTVSGLVYQDTNGNNALDSGEPGIAGVTVTLSGTNGLNQAITATTTTAANGTYSFSTDSNGNVLRPGTYTVTETQPSGYLLGAAAVGTVNGAADGTVSSATKITSIAVTSGQNGVNYNFGDVLPVTVGGLVYHDINGNGALDSGEPGISGVTVTLSGTNGLGQSITATATTAANGTYTFTTDSNGNALRPGTYQIVETAPSGYLLGSAAVGTVNGTADGTVSSATKIASIALTSGQNGINYTFGDVKAVTVSGLV
jgi:5-hydroxyisourate hydrolase-like protein (transthyretin family)